jgi:hypothetical protein
MNCVIYGFTSRLDRVATIAASKEIYYMYGRLIMATTTLASCAGTGKLTEESLISFTKPKVAVMLLCVCALDAVYMLSLYKAFTLISPVYVAAIKRGGGVLLGSLIGALGFGEPMRGRGIPILAMTTSVVLLCIK